MTARLRVRAWSRPKALTTRWRPFPPTCLKGPWWGRTKKNRARASRTPRPPRLCPIQVRKGWIKHRYAICGGEKIPTNVRIFMARDSIEKNGHWKELLMGRWLVGCGSRRIMSIRSLTKLTASSFLAARVYLDGQRELEMPIGRSDKNGHVSGEPKTPIN